MPRTTSKALIPAEDDIVFRYTRAQAIEDGTLVSLSRFPEPKEAGLRFPLACTARVWEEVVQVNDRLSSHGQSIAGRLWDLCFMLAIAIRQQRQKGGDRVDFALRVLQAPLGQTQRPQSRLVHLYCLCGPGDDGEPVLTVMFPDED